MPPPEAHAQFAKVCHSAIMPSLRNIQSRSIKEQEPTGPPSMTPGHFCNVLDMLRNTVFPPGPVMYKKGPVCASTVNVLRPQPNGDPAIGSANPNRLVVIHPRLRKVVYHETMVTQLLEEGVFEKITSKWKGVLGAVDPGTDEGRMLLTKTHPFFTTADNPPVANSEKDPEDWVFSALIRPAVRCLQAIRKGEVQEVYKDFDRYTASASSEVKPVPDGVVVRCGSGHPLSGLAKDATIEVKTVNSLQLGTRTPRDGLPGSFEETLTDCDGQVPPGTAMRFCYPKDDKFTSSLSHQTKILLQVSIIYQPSRSVKLTQAAHRSGIKCAPQRSSLAFCPATRRPCFSTGGTTLSLSLLSARDRARSFCRS